MLEQFSRFGRELFLQGTNSSHSGNMSIRAGDRIFITRCGSMLPNLKWTSSLEASCKTLFLHRLLSPRDGGEGVKEW